MKQHLKIQVFWGYSFNAVKTQICIAISTFLLVAIMKKELKIERDLYEILQILSVSQFEKTALVSLLNNSLLQKDKECSQKPHISVLAEAKPEPERSAPKGWREFRKGNL
jgi:uncharacterized membrane protein